MIHDKKVLRVCGKTSLSNERRSIVTMMQVSESTMYCSDSNLAL